MNTKFVLETLRSSLESALKSAEKKEMNLLKTAKNIIGQKEK